MPLIGAFAPAFEGSCVDRGVIERPSNRSFAINPGVACAFVAAIVP